MSGNHLEEPSQRARLSTAIIRGVPTVELPFELCDRWVNVNVVRSTSLGYRYMTVRQTVVTNMSSVAMAPLSQTRPRQGTGVLEHELRKQCDGTRVRQVLQKAQGLVETLDEFLPKLGATTT